MPENRKDTAEGGNAVPAAGPAESTSDEDPVIASDAADGEATDMPVSKTPTPWVAPGAHRQYRLLSGHHGDVHREDSLGNHWSVPWSDLMMVMFVLFAGLVTAQALQRDVPEFIDRDKDKIVREETPSRTPSLEPLTRINVFEKSQQAVREANIDNVEIVLLDDQSVKVSVQGPMFFDRGKDELQPDVQIFLDTLARVIRQTRYQVNVIGHTDDTPISNQQFASNWELSLMRATQVTKHLISSGGIDPARFTIMGRSQYDPAIPNANDNNRSLNRRVEIIITRDISSSVENRS